MDHYQFWTLLGILLAGFGWIIHQIRDLDKRLASVENRLTVVETILAMMGMPIKALKGKDQ